MREEDGDVQRGQFAGSARQADFPGGAALVLQHEGRGAHPHAIALDHGGVRALARFQVGEMGDARVVADGMDEIHAAPAC
jgi:hypothetical protein